MTWSTLPRIAVLAATLAVAAGSCSNGGDGGARPTEDVGEVGPAGARWTPPEEHPSDWTAPPVELPAAPRPYGPSPAATAEPAFYAVDTLDAAEVAAVEPGTVLRSETVELTGPLAGASGWRILYRSTDRHGAPAVVSGMVLVPEGPASGPRPVAAWAHGTTGIADRCAPSATGNLFYDDYAAVGRDLLDQGFVVAATDYHGLGTPGVHSYHRSDELAQATVDSVLAAHSLAAVPLTPQWVTIGHSEGGLAVLAADERHTSAPIELDYRGSVVAAPSAQLEEVASLMFDFGGRGYGALLLEAVAGTEPRLDPEVALAPEAAARRSLLTHGCWEEAVPGFDDLEPDQMLADPSVGELLEAVLEEWTGFDPTRVSGPLLVVQGDADEAVLPPLTAALVEDLCAAGVPTEFRTYPGVGHDPVMAASADDVADWFQRRLAGEPPSSSC